MEHRNPSHFDDLLLGAWKIPLSDPLIDFFYEEYFLVQRKVAGELVTPIHYVRHRLRLGPSRFRVYLYHPYLVGFRVAQLTYGRVLRKQAIPIHAPVDMHSPEQGWDCGRREDRIDGDLVSTALEGFEFAATNINGANEQQRARRFYELFEALKIDMLFQHTLQQILPPRRIKIRAGGRCATDVGEERFVWSNQLFSSLSQSDLAELSLQKESNSSTALLASFINNPYQANKAQMAPPEVPLKATIS